MPDAFLIINIRADLLARVRERARSEGQSMGRTAGQALVTVLPHMQRTWQDYTWPAPKVYKTDGVRNCTLEVCLPDDAFTAYTKIALDLVLRAVSNGTDNLKRDPIDGKWDATRPPVRWVLQQALREAFVFGQAPAADVPPAALRPRADGPLMSCRLPVKLIDWARQRGSVSAFIRGAVESQLPVICVRDRVPPKSQLLMDVPDAPVAYRTNAQDHGYLEATARQYKVSKTHLVRALCLMHYVHMNKPAVPAAPIAEAA